VELLPLKNLLSYIRRKNKSMNVEKKMTCSLFFLPREGEVRIQRSPLVQVPI
jgi:hypothetical protein